MPDLKRLRQKLKYNSILRVLRDGLVRFRIQIAPFYIVEEGLHLNPTFPPVKNLKDYSIDFLKENEIDCMCSIQERQYKKESLEERIKKGDRCLVVKKDGKIVGFTWFNLFKFDFPNNNFSLKENEAYLFDAYVLMDYRGEKIAPFMRYQSYKELEKLNRTVLYSVSELLNKQSISFKKKLNARFIELVLYVNLFNKIKFNKRIKKYIRK